MIQNQLNTNVQSGVTLNTVEFHHLQMQTTKELQYVKKQKYSNVKRGVPPIKKQGNKKVSQEGKSQCDKIIKLKTNLLSDNPQKIPASPAKNHIEPINLGLKTHTILDSYHAVSHSQRVKFMKNGKMHLRGNMARQRASSEYDSKSQKNNKQDLKVNGRRSSQASPQPNNFISNVQNIQLKQIQNPYTMK